MSFPRRRESSENIMAKISRICFLILFAICIAPAARAEETSVRRYRLPAYGILELDVPKSWKDEIKQPPDNLPPGITMNPSAGNKFSMVITPTWDLGGFKNFNSRKAMEKGMNEEKEQLAGSAVEEKIKLNPIKGPETHGFYFIATDKNPPPGEWKHLVRAVVGCGDLLVSVTFLSHKKESEAVSDVVAMARTMRQRKFAPPNEKQKKWALATCAVLTEAREGRHDVLADRKPTLGAQIMERSALSRWWGIENRMDLFEMLLWLQTGGHRKNFDEMGKRIASLSPGEIAGMKNAVAGNVERSNDIDIVLKHYTEFGDKSILGWDYTRYVALCRWGYVVGFISEDEAWEKIMPVARLLQQRFDSWEDLGNNYIIGRRFWSAKETARQGKLIRSAFNKLLTDPSSPWNTIPWDLDMTPVLAGTDEEST